MREKEKARIARLKQQKADKLEERKRRQQETFDEKFIPPPLRFLRKDHRNRSSSLPIVRPPDPGPSTPKTSPQPRKSSLSTSPSKGGKRVSWASSTSELDVDGHTSEKPMEGNEAGHRPRKRASSHSTLMPIPSLGYIASSSNWFDDEEPSTNTPRRRASSLSTFKPIPDLFEYPSPVPQARTSVRRASVSVEPRSRRGQEMIAATTPEIVSRWATTNDLPSSTFRDPGPSHFPTKYYSPQL